MKLRRRRRDNPKQEAEYFTSAAKDKEGFDVKYINSFIGRGVFSCVHFDKGDFLLEYRGQLINKAECERRQKLYHDAMKVFMMCNCSITDEGCAALASALRSNSSSHLRELSLKGNKTGESGVKLLSDLKEDPHCKLEKLQLCNCSITDEGCAALASALRSNSSSHLRELSLKGNKTGESGVKLLSDLKEDSTCKLEKLQ
ncbi:hypothetical protein PGIGA_G00240050 [Pangasianodon gigas]|uniref:Uncharacterized protein n=1 Tax=Pangasianodon gigas TaxID=30993 RepID=A0ACC5WP43_PANGG|nr:hypothetical protein [Pangasianodon gigas]